MLAICSSLLLKGLPPPGNSEIHGRFKCLIQRKPTLGSSLRYRKYCSVRATGAPNHLKSVVDVVTLPQTLDSIQLNHLGKANILTGHMQRMLVLAELDPATAKLAIAILGPILSAFSFLFIIRIVMSWYPKLPVSKFPYVVVYAPTEPVLFLTRKLIPPLGGVDVTPVVWFALLSFLNEILVGPQGLLVLVSQQVSAP